MGRRQRLRPVAEVMDEITASNNRQLFFVDDALALNRPVATELFGAIQPLGLKWAGQGGVSLAEDVPLLRLMKRSGCVGVLLGFESVQSERGGDLNKLKHLSIDFMEAMRRFHGEGIAVMGAFIFGFDHETVDVFDSTLEFVNRSRLDIAELRILTPFPGTPLYARLREEGRLFAPEWWLHGYPPDTLLFRPRGMTPDQLVDGFVRLNRQVYSRGSILRRFLGMGPLRRGAFGSAVYAGPEHRHARAVPKRHRHSAAIRGTPRRYSAVREIELLGRGLIAGLVIAAPPGPVNVLCMQRTLARGWRAGLVCGLGAAAGDTLYGATAAFFTSTVFEITLLTRELSLIRLAGGALLVAAGFCCFRRRTTASYAPRGDLISTFLLSLANPTVVLSFLAVLAALGLGGPRRWELTVFVVAGISCRSAALVDHAGYCRRALPRPCR